MSPTRRQRIIYRCIQWFWKGKNQNHLSDAQVERIIDTYKRKETIDKYSYSATLQEIADNDYNLNIPRYSRYIRRRSANWFRSSPTRFEKYRQRNRRNWTRNQCIPERTWGVERWVIHKRKMCQSWDSQVWRRMGREQLGDLTDRVIREK